MRDLLLVLGTSAGGVGRHVRMLAEGVTATGASVVVAGPREAEHDFGFTAVGARFAPLPIADRPRPAEDLRTVRELRRLAAGAGVVHAHGLRAGALAGLAGGPVVVTLHNALTAGGAVGVVYRVLERVVARRARHILVVSPDLGERMRRLGARRVSPAVVPAPLLGAPTKTAAEVRAELGAGERPVLLTLARLAQQKGLETLLDAAALPYGTRPLFVVAGDGPLRGALQARIDAEGLPVTLPGVAAPQDLLQVAAALVVPSRWEGQPLSVQEALRAGRPVVATAVGGLPDMVGDAGLLVPPDDPRALQREIARLLEAPGLAAQLSANAAARRLPTTDDALRAVSETYDTLNEGK
ncbi:glycosyltransferase family 4 protein [Streptosporangiaceae bacterium NEAU-GS5]|nr:glycosyltransferase family 4 protein [Streptosporangiaceae bacterium NEAU-GS5]